MERTVPVPPYRSRAYHDTDVVSFCGVVAFLGVAGAERVKSHERSLIIEHFL